MQPKCTPPTLRADGHAGAPAPSLMSGRVAEAARRGRAATHAGTRPARLAARQAMTATVCQRA